MSITRFPFIILKSWQGDKFSAIICGYGFSFARRLLYIFICFQMIKYHLMGLYLYCTIIVIIQFRFTLVLLTTFLFCGMMYIYSFWKPFLRYWWLLVLVLVITAALLHTHTFKWCILVLPCFPMWKRAFY